MICMILNRIKILMINEIEMKLKRKKNKIYDRTLYNLIIPLHMISLLYVTLNSSKTIKLSNYNQIIFNYRSIKKNKSLKKILYIFLYLNRTI